MNGLKFYDINAKMPFTLKEIEYLHGVYKETFKHVLESFGLDGRKNFILWGCRCSEVNLVISVTEGAVYLGGEILFFAGVTAIAVEAGSWHIRKKTTLDTQKQFSDGVSREIHERNEAEFFFSPTRPTTDYSIDVYDDRLTDLLSANHTHGQYATTTMLDKAIADEQWVRHDRDAEMVLEYKGLNDQRILSEQAEVAARIAGDADLRSKMVERHWATTAAIGVTAIQLVGSSIGMVRMYGLYEQGRHKQRVTIDTDASETIALIDCNFPLYDGYLFEFIIQKDDTHVGDVKFLKSPDPVPGFALNTKIEIVAIGFAPVNKLRFGSTADFYDTGTGLLHYQLTGTQKASVKFEYDAVVSVWRLVDTKIYNV